MGLDKAEKRVGIQAGKDLEMAVLGAPKIRDLKNTGNYMKFDDAVAYVKSLEQPTRKSDAITKLRKRVAELCRLHPHQIGFYSAVGTPLDFYHGVDAFFEKSGQIVTMDVSMRDKEIQKATVLLPVEYDAEGGVKIADEDIERASRKIVHEFGNTAAQRKVA